MSLISSNWPAPAKLNLFLHITGRRSDGYHLLQTAFQFISICDMLNFEVTDNGQIRRLLTHSDIRECDDLVIRAAKALKSVTGSRFGVNIQVDKKLPIGSGLGGGSSNAATTLVALNKLWHTNLSIEKLAEIGLALGADVPVFIRGQAAWAEGIGERLTPVYPKESYYLIIYPNCAVSTKDIFMNNHLTRDAEPITIEHLFSQKTDTFNHCEPVVKMLYPVVEEALNWLGRYANSRLTGTGSAIFAAFSDKIEAHRVCSELPKRWWAKVVQGQNCSPLLKRLEQD